MFMLLSLTFSPNDLVATSGELLQCLPSLVCSSLGFSVVVFFRTFSSSFFCAPTPARSRSSPAHLTRWGPRSISDQSWITTTSSPSLAPPPTSARGKSLLTGNRHRSLHLCVRLTGSSAGRRARHAHSLVQTLNTLGCIAQQGPALPLGEGCTGARGGRTGEVEQTTADTRRWGRLRLFFTHPDLLGRLSISDAG